MTLTINERRENEREPPDVLNGMPWQVKAVFLMGVPSAIAVYMVYTMTSGIVPAMQAQNQTQKDVLIALAQSSSDHAAARAQNESILRVLRVTCVNATDKNDARERCLQ